MSWKEIVLGLLLALLCEELLGWTRRLCRWLVRGAASQLPPEVAERYASEWLETLESRPAVSRILFALDLFRAAYVMKQDLCGPTGKVSSTLVVRSADLVLASFLLILFSPMLLVCMILLKIENGKTVPPLGKKERIGRNGHLIYVYQFWIPRSSDGQMGPVGRFLWAASLISLPQLINVLKGDLSLVGPRPESPQVHAERVARIPDYAQRLQIRPGITGPSQLDTYPVHDDSDSMRSVEFDRELLSHYGLRAMLRYLWRTLVVVLTRSGKT